MNYAKEKWHITAGKGIQLKANKGIEFDWGNGAASYIETPAQPITGPITLVVQVTTAVGVAFDAIFDEGAEYGPMAPQVRVMLRGRGGQRYSRWYADAGITLRAGRYGLTVSANPQHWTSVYGICADATKQARNVFNNIKREPTHIALVFGGGNDYGHGVRITPPTSKATFRLITLRHD